MAHVMARFGPGSTEIYRNVLDQNQGKNGGFPPFLPWFSDVVEQENGAPQGTKMGTQIIGEFRCRVALAKIYDLHFIVWNVVLRRPRWIDDRLVVEMPLQRALAAFHHTFVRVDLVGIDVGHFETAVP